MILGVCAALASDLYLMGSPSGTKAQAVQHVPGEF